MNVGVIIACHNRVHLTKIAIESLENYKPVSWNLHYFICDDGSTDGTSDYLNSLPLKITMLRGSGDLFWAKSMYFAMSEAKANHYIDSYLLFNDDVVLNNRFAISNFEKLTRRFPESIVVGQLFDNSKNEISYGGLIRPGRHPFRTRIVNAKSHPIEVDTFHANFAFVSASVVDKVGLLDPKYSHGYADFDYGYRARKLGIKIRVNPGYIGLCSLNEPKNPEKINILISYLFSIKGRPLKSQVRFARKFGGIEWPIYVISGYLSPLLKLFFRTVIRKIDKRNRLNLFHQGKENNLL